jgi:hypothetical protein
MAVSGLPAALQACAHAIYRRDRAIQPPHHLISGANRAPRGSLLTPATNQGDHA